MSRKARLELEAQQAQQAFEAAQTTPDTDNLEAEDSGFDAAPVDNFEDERVDLRRELEESRREKETLAREREKLMQERDLYSSGLKDKETAAEKASREAAELRAELEQIRQDQELTLSDADFEGLDPEAAPILKKLIEKQSRAISKMETARMRKELEAEILQKARSEVMNEVESRQQRSKFDAILLEGGDETIYNSIQSDDFKEFVKADELRLMAFTNAANTRDDASARVIKRLYKDFQEKAVKKPAQTPRTGARLATAATESDDDSVQVDHAKILQMVKSPDPAIKKRGKELLEKAAKRLEAQLRSRGAPAYG